jgi:hypothetical protein
MNLSMANHWVCRRRWKLFFLALLAGIVGWGATASAVTFSTSLDRDVINVGESADLSLTFDGGGPKGNPSMPNIPGLDIAYVGPSSQFSFVNGQTSSTITHHFTVTARRPGVYTIPALAIEVDGRRLTSEPLKLTVSQTGPPSEAGIKAGSEVAFARLVLPKRDLYVGEVSTAELQIWLRDDVQNFGNLQLSSLPADGFNLGKMTEHQRYRSQQGDRTYTVVPIAITLTAVKSGTLSLGPLTAQLVIVLPSADRGGDPFFRQFFNSGEQKQISVTTDTLDVQALKLPPNAPADFNGAIGRFSMTVTEGPTNVSAGDPITVHVRIEGRGALDTIRLPDFSTWNGFKTYPPTAKTEYADQQGLDGDKTFEQIVTPQNPDVRELPGFSFTYFDPDRKAYQTVSQPALPITVHPAGAAPVPSIAVAKPATQESTPAQQDILPAKVELGVVTVTGTPLLAQPGFLALQTLPVLAFLAAFIWRRHQDNLANNPRLRRQRQVAQLVRDGLVELRQFAAANDSEQFFAALFRLLQEQLGERLDCPASAITESVVDDRLGALVVPPATLAGLRELFQLCNQARYAPVRDPQELSAVAGKFETVTRELQSLKV